MSPSHLNIYTLSVCNLLLSKWNDKIPRAWALWSAWQAKDDLLTKVGFHFHFHYYSLLIIVVGILLALVLSYHFVYSTFRNVKHTAHTPSLNPVRCSLSLYCSLFVPYSIRRHQILSKLSIYEIIYESGVDVSTAVMQNELTCKFIIECDTIQTI